MGVICSASSKSKGNPVEQMIRKSNMNHLLDQWPASFIYLLKQKFSSVAYFEEDQRLQNSKKSREGLDYQAFMKLFPRLKQQPQVTFHPQFPKDIQQRAFTSFDVDQSSRIDFKEFCFVLSLIINSDESSRAAFIFQLYDLDNDQALSKGEFKHFLKANFQYVNQDEEMYWIGVSQARFKKSPEKPDNAKKYTKEPSIDKNQRINRIMNMVFADPQKIKLKLDDFHRWIQQTFDLIKYFEIFELVPGPLKEREIIRQIMKSSGDEKALSQQHYYVISYKWWERWRFYINYSFAQKNKDGLEKLAKEAISADQKPPNRTSRKPSNVSLVDLDLGNTIPSEMKEDHSINRKLAKAANLPTDMNGPGKLMRNAKENFISLDQIALTPEDFEQKQSPTFRTPKNDQPAHKHSHSLPFQFVEPEPIDMNLDADSLSGRQVFHSISGEFTHMPVKSNKYFQKVQKKIADSDPDPVMSQEPKAEQRISMILDLVVGLQESANFDQGAHESVQIPADGETNQQFNSSKAIEEPQGELVQGQQGSSRKPDPPLSPITDPLRNPPVDYQVLKYGICETEENDCEGLVSNEEGYLQSLRPGQIDNSDLQGEFEGELKLNILNNHDYVLVPEEAWNSLVQWYGCNSQVYKRKVFTDPKRQINILDMYPPVIKGFVVDSKGCINYLKKVTLMISSRKKMQELYEKFKKRMKLGLHKNYHIFYKRIGEPWQESTQPENTLMDCHIDTGTFVVFVKRNKLSSFKIDQKIKEPEQNGDLVNSNIKRSEFVSIRLGDNFDVQHPITNDWKLCHVCEVLSNGARFHIRKESYMNEFELESYDILRRVEWPGQKSRNDNKQTPLLQTPGMALNNQLSLVYPGLGNQGNTCFMNTVLQCIMHTPLFRDYLVNRSYQEELVSKRKDSKLQSYLVVELARLITSLNNFRTQNKVQSYSNSLTPYDLKKAVDSLLPQFSGYEQHDAQEFLSLFLDAISEELKRSKQLEGAVYHSVIQELFMGKTINEMQCTGCGYKSARQEEFFTLSLPIPIQDEVNFEVTFVGRCSKSFIPPLKKYGIKVSKYGTLKDFIMTFEKVSGVSSQRVDFIEVYRNNVHKPLYNIDAKTTIRHLGMKPYDELYAYEILKQSKEIEEEANAIMQLTPQKKQWDIEDYVDVLDQSQEWRFGQIKEQRTKSNSPEIYYRIKIIYDKSEVLQWFSNQRNQLAPYRTKALQRKVAHKLNVVNRICNPACDTLERFAIPFIITVPNWFTWKEFRHLVYSQAKRFIDFTYFKKKSFSRVRESRNPMNEDLSARQFFRQSQNLTIRESDQERPIINESASKDDAKLNRLPNDRYQNNQAQSVYLGEAKNLHTFNRFGEPDETSLAHNGRMTEKDVKLYRARAFSDSAVKDEVRFLASHDFPYRLRLIDQTTYCCIQCDKPLTYNKAKLGGDKYCKGCELGLDDAPLNLNFMCNNQPLIALDWIDSLAFNPFSVSTDHDASYVQLKQEKKERKDRITQEECFNLFTTEEQFEIQCDSCKQLHPATTRFSLSQMPNILILHLKRFQFRDGYLEKIENDIDFPLKTLNLSKWTYGCDPGSRKEKEKVYDLYAVANHMGNGQEGHYTSYVSVHHEGQEIWLNFDDDQVRVMNPQKIMSQYTYLLFYKRREFSSSAIINLTYRSFGKRKLP